MQHRSNTFLVSCSYNTSNTFLSLSLPTTNQSIHQNPIRNPKTKIPCLWFVALELSSMESKEWEPTITTGACNAKELLEFLLQL